MAIHFTYFTTSQIKGWEKEDAQKWLRYMHQANEGMVLQSNRAVTEIIPTGDYTGFIFNGSRVYSNAQTADIIIDAIACDHRGRMQREEREFLRAVTGRLDGRPNIADRAEASVSRIFFNIFG
jgi:hypothetical protein